MSKSWGTVGAWALEAERAEAEERENLARNPNPNPTPTPTRDDFPSFPSLKESVTTKPKKKKGGATTMSLSQFTTGSHVGGRGEAGMDTRRLTPDEMMRLPTGPRERSAEEMDQGRLGGGFRSYGGGRPSGPRGGDGGGDGSWGGGGGGGGGRRGYGGFDDDRRSSGGPAPRGAEFDLPSRADEADNWAMGKKPVARMDSGRQDRYGMGDSGPGRQDRYAALGGGSRADEVDSWASGKRAAPPARSSGGFGSGFRDPAASDSDRWSRSGPPPPREGGERTRLVFEPPRADASVSDVAKTTRPNPFGAARPREEILAAKGLDWKKLDSDIETKKTSRPTSSHSSRPSSAHSNRPESPTKQVLEVAVKPRPKVNPFGDAKPREVLLEEKGKDWRKIDFELEHRSVDRPETMEEQALKEEIEHLKKELERESTGNANGVLIQGSGGDQTDLSELLHKKENDLEFLIRDLDDKVRFGPKALERPGSGSGRSTGFPERTPSLSGMSDEYRNVEYIDRPQSRGMSDARTRPVDDRRAFQGGREGGFFSSREDRPRSRDRW